LYLFARSIEWCCAVREEAFWEFYRPQASPDQITQREGWHRSARSGTLRAVIFGVSDGLVSNLSLGWALQLYLVNPITLGVLGMQRALWVAGADLPRSFPPELGPRILVALLISAMLLWISHRVFQKLQGNFAQEL